MGEVISLVDRQKEYCFDKILDVINILDDYDVEIDISKKDILLILNDLYDLYLEKKIVYQYLEDMLIYFNEICGDIAYDDEVFDVDSICNGIIGCYELMVPLGIEREDFRKVLKKVKAKIGSRRHGYEE